MTLVLEIDWSAFVDDSLFRAAKILSANAVISINSGAFSRHIDWHSLANIFIKIKEMRIKYINFIDKVENRIPDQGEQPRPGISQRHIEYYENLRDEGIRLLNEGDAKLRAIKWDYIIDSPEFPTVDQAVGMLLTLHQSATIV
jgi:hypothetical protein